jgi:hypothetical protein
MARSEHFNSVFQQMDQMDRDYAHPAYTAPGRFFHGTTHAIKDGVVRPADAVDKGVSEYSFGDPGDMSEGDHAFAIRNNENYAWHAATTFHPSLRRARVYEVEPAADMKPGPWNKEHPNFLQHHELDDPDHYPTVSKDSDDYPVMTAMREEAENARANHQDEWASQSGFPVRKRIDVMPGRQGTFPNISWGRFSNQPYNQRMNHPDDEDVKYGVGSSLEDRHAEALKENQPGHNWRKDAAPHSELREMAGRPQKRLDTLF